MNQDPIVVVEGSYVFNIQDAWFNVDSFEDVVNVVVHHSYPVKPFCCSEEAEFVGIMQVHSVYIEVIETFAGGEYVGSGGCWITGEFCERQPYLLGVLPMVAVDVKVLLVRFDSQFTESIWLPVVGSRDLQVDVELAIRLVEKLPGKLQATIQHYTSWQTIKFPDIVDVRAATSSVVQLPLAGT